MTMDTRAFAATTSLVIVAAALAVAAVCAPAAQAEKFVHGLFTGPQNPADPFSGQLDGQFVGPRDIAVNLSSVADGGLDPLGESVDGFVYVTDDQNHRVQVFDSDGEFRFMWGRGVESGGVAAEVCDRSERPCTVGSPDRNGGEGGMFDRPQGVAIDQDTGHVFVRERANRRVQEFEADGTFVRTWGWDVIAANPETGFETCTTPATCQAGEPGSGVGQFGTSGSSATGIDVHQPTGEVYAVDPTNSRIQRFAIPANPADPIPAPSVIGSAVEFTTNNAPAHLAVDDGGILYASDGSSMATTEIDRYDTNTDTFMEPVAIAPHVTDLDSLATVDSLEIDLDSGNLYAAVIGNDGDVVTRVLELADPDAPLAAGVSLADSHVDRSGLVWQGIGVDPDLDRLYLSAQIGGSRVFVAEEGPAAGALVSFDPYSGVGAFGATVNVQINSNGALETAYDVQVARSSSPSSFETVASGVAPAGTEAVLESVSLSGLRPKTLYLVRVITRKPFGNPDIVVDGPVLLTDPAPPGVSGVRADSVSQSSARLVARINPYGTGARYRFEWGQGDFHNVVPLPDAAVGSGYDFEFVSEQLTGLDPGATYQLRLVATSDDSQLGATTSATRTFTTPTSASQPARAYELVSPADKISGVGVGQWYAGPGSALNPGRPARVGDRFGVRAGPGNPLLDAAHGYSSDWAFAERKSSVEGWRSHSPITHPACAAEGPRETNIEAAADDLSVGAWDSNGGTLHILEGTCDWDGAEIRNPSWIGGWDGRWEIFGPTDLDQIDAPAGAQARVAVSGDGRAVVGTSEMRGLEGDGCRLDPPGVGLVWVGLAGGVCSDPSVDLVGGSTVFLDDVSGGLSDSFPGDGVRELVHVCDAGTEVPAVGAGGVLEAGGCGPVVADRRAALVSDRGASTALGGSDPVEGTVSRDGSRVFFAAPDPGADGVPDGRTAFCEAAGEVCPAQLFVWQRNPDGSRVVRWISRPVDELLGVQDGSLLGAARFDGASRDGDKVFFRTNSPLTVDDPNGLGAPTPGGVTVGPASDQSWDLYMYDLPDQPGADPADGQLTRISAGPDGESDCNRVQPTGSPDAAMLRFVSEDGSRVYFVCSGPLGGVDALEGSDGITVPGGDPSTADQANMYLYDANIADPAGRWSFVARLPSDTSGDGPVGCATTGTDRGLMFSAQFRSALVSSAGGGRNCVRGSVDGLFVVFWSVGRLTADDPDGVSADVYGFDAGGGGLVRVSGPQGGVGGTYECVTGGPSAGLRCFGDLGFDQVGSGVSGDGSRPAVVFGSRSRLVPEDRDGAYDVYEWVEGRLSLVSTGESADNDGAYYVGSDRSGENVFFATRDRLTWQDSDAVLDVYSARVGGGIVEPPAPPVCSVIADGCQPAGGGLGLAPVGSTVAGEGNAPDRPARAAGRVRAIRPGRRALRRAGRSRVVRVAVRARNVGRVRGVVRVRMRGRGGRLVWRRAGADAARVRAGKAVVAVRLNRRARVQLARRGRLAVRVIVAGRGERASVRFVLRGARR